LAEGNQRANKLVAPIWAVPSTDQFAQANQYHEFFHQLAKVLCCQFGLSESDAWGLVQSCPDRQQYTGGLAPGVSLRGTGPLEIWQTDVMHVPEFGKQKYVHVCLDCFSLVVWATAQ
ncbi:POK6 protein, partial [Aegotheles bennettii]|nr:POK6 protein [Aegotheles bennettii]